MGISSRDVMGGSRGDSVGITRIDYYRGVTGVSIRTYCCSEMNSMGSSGDRADSATVIKTVLIEVYSIGRSILPMTGQKGVSRGGEPVGEINAYSDPSRGVEYAAHRDRFSE